MLVRHGHKWLKCIISALSKWEENTYTCRYKTKGTQQILPLDILNQSKESQVVFVKLMNHKVLHCSNQYFMLSSFWSQSLAPFSRQITNITEDKGSPSPSTLVWGAGDAGADWAGAENITEPGPERERERGQWPHTSGDQGPCHPDHYAIIITYRHSTQSQQAPQGSVLHSRGLWST